MSTKKSPKKQKEQMVTIYVHVPKGMPQREKDELKPMMQARIGLGKVSSDIVVVLILVEADIWYRRPEYTEDPHITVCSNSKRCLNSVSRCLNGLPEDVPVQYIQSLSM